LCVKSVISYAWTIEPDGASTFSFKLENAPAMLKWVLACHSSHNNYSSAPQLPSDAVNFCEVH